MTTILPSARSPFDVIMEQVGGSLGQSLPKAIERQSGLSAIDQLQSALKDANGDISKMLPAIARAYTLNPNLERSGIAEQALMRAKSSMGTGEVQNAINPQSGSLGGQVLNKQPQTQSGTTQVQQTQPTQQQNTQGIFLSNFIPQNIGELITPEQKANILDKVAKNGGDVEFTKQRIDDYNKGKINFNELANANVEKQAANVQRMLGFEDEIKNRISSQLPKDTPESEKNIYYNMIRPALESKGVKSFSDAWQKVSDKIDNFRKLNEGFVNKIPEADILGLSPNQERMQRESAKPILSQDPLGYNTLEQAYIQKGHSPITVSKTLKPLPENINQTLKSAGDYKDLIYPLDFSTSEFPERMMQRNLDVANEKQQKDITKIVPKLREEWNEDLSLFNMYADLKSKGWSLNNITSLFDEVSDKFGPRQQAERAQLNESMRVPMRYLGWPWSKQE